MDNKALFARMREVLEVPLSGDAKIRFKQCAELDSLRYKLSEARVEARGKLVERRFRALPGKAKDITELDRKTIMEADMTLIGIEKDFLFLEALESIVSDRLALARNLA